MFHVELRQFPHVARLFNLSREELASRILVPWVRGESFDCNDRRWPPDRARLTIYEGPQLAPEEIGMGRGWPNVTRSGAEVTASLLEEAQQAMATATPAGIGELGQEILARCEAGPIPVRIALTIASERHPQWRASDRLALAEQAVWALLHRGQVQMLGAVGGVPQEEWEAVLLDLATWIDPEAPILLALPGAG
jgi:hypothetical protein